MNTSDIFSLVFRGQALEESQANSLEKRLGREASDLESRLSLLGFYYKCEQENNVQRLARFKHVKWLIDNNPTALYTLDQFASLDKFPFYFWSLAADAWEHQLTVHKNDPKIGINASVFFLERDRKRAFLLLRSLKVRFPDKPQFRRLLGSHSYKAMKSAECDQARREFAQCVLEEGRAIIDVGVYNAIDTWEIHSQMSEAAFELEDLEETIFRAKLAPKGLEFTPSPKEFCNAMLGLVALRSTDFKRAKAHMLRSSCSRFFPHRLAQELFNLGELELVSQAIQQYLGCDVAQLDVEVALQAIRNGLAP